MTCIQKRAKALMPYLDPLLLFRISFRHGPYPLTHLLTYIGRTENFHLFTMR